MNSPSLQLVDLHPCAGDSSEEEIRAFLTLDCKRSKTSNIWVNLYDAIEIVLKIKERSMIKLKCISFAMFAILMTAQAGEQELKPLFNGSDFSGWQEPENNIWWTIEDGVLIGKNDPELLGSTLWTSMEYKDFILQLDFRFGPGSVDSGVFIREVSEQIQIGISGSLKRDMTCSPYVAGKGYPVEAVGVAALLKQDGWNTARIQAVGNVYTVWLNGTQVLEYPSLTAAEKGPLGLQIHPDRDMQISFKNILIADIVS